jgi:hypothetical protein
MGLARRSATPFRAVASWIPPIHRLRSTRDALAVQNAELRHELEHRAFPGSWIRHHPYGHQPAGDAGSDGVATADEDRVLVQRIIDAYARSLDVDYYEEDSWWHVNRQHLTEVDNALVARDVDAVTRILRTPMENSLLYGYELFGSEATHYDGQRWRQEHADRCKDLLMRLAEALGTLSLENPEGGPWGENIELSAEEGIARVEKAMSISLPIRPVQHAFHGITARGGVITERMIHAAYCAYRVAQLLADTPNPRVLEIGAGLGYTAYYAAQLGVGSYEIVDLPLTNVAQAYFLGRSLGPDRIVLEGEGRPADMSDGVTIRTPRAILEPRAPVDLVMNVDSLTEVGVAQASRYADWILEIAPLFLSINHEANAYRVLDLFTARGARIERFPYWLRVGYVEEIIRAR